MQRYYRISKCNPSFSRTFVTVRRYLKKDIEPYYLVIYKWQGEESQNFVMPRHGNASNPHCGSYYRKDKLLKNKVDELIDSGKSTEQIYSELKKISSNTVSETVCSPKLINNRKFAKKETNGNVLSEAEALIYNVKSINSMMSTVVFSERDYVSCSFLPHMISNLKRFCVNGNSIWRVDTTFELVDGLWLTDSTYTNEALVNSQEKHPEFPGPSMWYFHKDQNIYR